MRVNRVMRNQSFVQSTMAVFLVLVCLVGVYSTNTVHAAPEVAAVRDAALNDVTVLSDFYIRIQQLERSHGVDTKRMDAMQRAIDDLTAENLHMKEIIETMRCEQTNSAKTVVIDSSNIKTAHSSIQTLMF